MWSLYVKVNKCCLVKSLFISNLKNYCKECSCQISKLKFITLIDLPKVVITYTPMLSNKNSNNIAILN